MGDDRIPPSVSKALFKEMREDYDAARLRDSGLKKYQVYHADLAPLPGREPSFPEDFTRVAAVEALSPDQAVNLTRFIDRPWQENPGVKAEGGIRTTEAGDLVVEPSGRLLLVGSDGLRELPRPDKHLDTVPKRGAREPDDDLCR